ncbi:MAG TPA: hypothetical protein VFD92_14795 [Candidatus Binatia bacterium]|nr:hypothetical protein [Candidatus Binatia bacterium]
MLKTALMIAGLAALLGASTACFGLFSKDDPDRPAVRSSCAGLTGQAKADCEKRAASQGR